MTGDDETVLRARVHDLVRELVGSGDRSLMVDEFDGDEYELRTVADAAQTMPFLTERRVVVARGVGRFVAEELPPILAYLEHPLDTTELVLVAGGGRLSKKLVDAVQRAGGTTTNTAPPSKAAERGAWVRAAGETRRLHLDARAVTAIVDRLGDDVGRLEGLLDVLGATFGSGARLGPRDVEPYLGESGGVPPWDLTDAIDAGDAAKALVLVLRMLHGSDRHPLQIMSILHGHYAKLAKLDGSDARSEHDAAAVLGIRAGYPARKALDASRRLGSDNIRRAITLLADADLDLRGRTDLENETVMEVLIARLSRLAPAGRR